MQNTFEFDTFTLNSKNSTFNIKNYNSMCLNKIKTYLQGLSSKYLLYLKVENDSKIEKICTDYYGTDNYCDLILLINQRDMVFDMAYSNDIVLSAIESDIEQYRNKVFKDPYKQFSKTAYDKLYKKLSDEYYNNNNKFKYIKVINSAHISSVIIDINNIISSYQDNIKLLDL